MSAEREKKWERLIQWISQFNGFEHHVEWTDVQGAGRGLVATTSRKDEQPLLVIPAPALLNPLTILTSGRNTIPNHLFPANSPCSHVTKRRKTTKGSINNTITANDNVDDEHSKGGVEDIIGRLNTTQILTLHLLLTRDKHRRHRSDWEVYLDTLPTTFRPWHPLSWVVSPNGEDMSSGKTKARDKNVEDIRYGADVADAAEMNENEGWKWWHRLAGLVPQGARANVQRVKKRYDDDISVLLRVLREEEPFGSQGLIDSLSTDDHLWAWLNVNTRSVSIPLGYPDPTDLYNHTLVPIFDLANHSSDPSLCIPKPRQTPTPTSTISSMTRTRPAKRNPHPHLLPGNIAFDFVAPERGIEKGTELRFEYHRHCNTELWAEYGFVEGLPMVTSSRLASVVGINKKHGKSKRLDTAQKQAMSEYDKKLKTIEMDLNDVLSRDGEMRNGRVDVEHLVEHGWEDTSLRDEKEKALRTINCWEDTTLVADPLPMPSHAFKMFLRVLHLDPAHQSRLGPISKGLIEFISEENERAATAALRDICGTLLEERTEALKALSDLERESVEGSSRGFMVDTNERSTAIRTVRTLWDEVGYIATYAS